MAGEAAWTIVYAIALFAGPRDGVAAIPPLAILLNLAWEILFIRRVTSGDRARRALYWSWLILDVGLCLELVWLPPAPELPSIVKNHMGLAVPLGLGAALLLHRSIDRIMRHPTRQAFALNLVMSALFLHAHFARVDGAGLWLSIAWLKFLGTGLISLANAITWVRRGGADVFGPLVMLAIFVLDVLYIALLI